MPLLWLVLFVNFPDVRPCLAEGDALAQHAALRKGPASANHDATRGPATLLPLRRPWVARDKLCSDVVMRPGSAFWSVPEFISTVPHLRSLQNPEAAFDLC